MTTPARALLLGSRYQSYSEVGVAAAGPDAAVALSRGKHPKGYPATDPNEDAALALADGGRIVLAVADGHQGFDAARAAIEFLSRAAGAWVTGHESPESFVERAITAVPSAVHDALSDGAPERVSSRTTLVAVAVDGTVAAGLNIGDSSAVVLGGRKARSLTEPTDFLGYGEPPRAHRFSADLGRDRWLLLGSDGLFDFLGRDWARALAGLPATGPAELAKAAVQAAFGGGAGDNVAVAVCRSPSATGQPA